MFIYPLSFLCAVKKYPVPPYSREKPDFEDGVFLSLNWWTNYEIDNLVIISYGFKGNSRSKMYS